MEFVDLKSLHQERIEKIVLLREMKLMDMFERVVLEGIVERILQSLRSVG